MKKEIWIEQNGGEYIGSCEISCMSFKQINNNTVMADEVMIEFDETIVEIKEIE